ncbi:fucolectin-1-like [Rhopilema esculentum]|uniref:fucolectin-1-like n=1 Tax=Rhopilema esculentum TaxID=499914 RepID=UPI0031DDD336
MNFKPSFNILYTTILLLTAENLAYKKPSLHSSSRTANGITFVASFGNDGNRTGDYQRCSITKADVTPWWQVDLTRQAAVTSVRIKNGATWGSDKINPFDVSVGDDKTNGGRNNALCVKVGTLARGELRKFDCPQVLMGRYVSVYLNRLEYLQVCEVEVYEDVF